MTIKAFNISKAILKFSEEKNIRNEEKVESILNFIEEKKIKHLLPKIIEHLEKLNSLQSRRTEFVINSKNEIQNNLISAIKKKLDVPEEISPKIQNSNEIQGGVIASYNHKQIDRSFLQINSQLYNHLKN